MVTITGDRGFTRTDAAANEWAIRDDVLRLRLWGSHSSFLLSPLPTTECLVGSAAGCALRLDDPTGRVSRMHARLIRQDGKWLLRDADSTNGIRIDGARRHQIVLDPGVEIGIGGITLVAESGLSIALHGFLARLLGWGSDRIAVVDSALRTVRMAAARRHALVLCGDGDLVQIARSIHRHSIGSDESFAVCDPRRQPGGAIARSATNYTTGAAAWAAAAGGSVCVRRERLPRDFETLVEALRTPHPQAQLIVCAETMDDCERYRVAPIVIPPLASRAGELDRIMDEFIQDAITEFSVQDMRFSVRERAWVRQHASSSVPEIEKATRRLVALRASPSVSNAATRLGMATVSLTRWIDRRPLPKGIRT
jgi:pSer/pThr/pTyr-binding forkhead associated (FHA) protein